MKAAKRRDLLLAASLANLCLVEVWRQMIFADPFLMPTWTWRDLAAALANLVLLSGLFYGAIVSGQRPGWRRLALHRGMFLLPAVVLINVVRQQFSSQVKLLADERTLLLGGSLAALVLLLALVRRPAPVFAAAEIVVLSLFAFLPLAMAQAAWRVARQAPPPALAPRLLGPAARRVLWLVYDEMDWRPVFGQRPADLPLPQLDRLRRESLYGETVYQAGVRTGEALSALVAGRQIVGSTTAGASQMLVRFAPGEPLTPLLRDSSIFAEARHAGLNAAFAGWYLPFCRLAAASLTDCYWEAMDTHIGAEGPSFFRSQKEQLLTLWPLADRQRHLARYYALLEHGERLASDPGLGFIMLHLPVPHEPGVYDRRSGRLTSWSLGSGWYQDNLALADRMLGEIRGAMERAGLWDSTTVILTSDHALRWYKGLNENTDPRIPFLVKLAGQKQGVMHATPFGAVILRDLTLAVLSGEVAHSEQLSAWLEQRGRAPMRGATAVLSRTGAASAPR